MLFFLEFKINQKDVGDCMTYFGSMTEEMDKKDMGPNIELLGRWSNPGSASGCCVCRAKTGADVQKWLFNWCSMATGKVMPILDDNQAREIILKKKPAFQVSYANVGDEAREGETLFFIKYRFLDGKRMDGYKAFANMTEAQDKGDAGNNRVLGRWHNLGQGCGFCIAASKSEMDAYRWAFNWAAMCDCEIVPVVTDKVARDIVKADPAFNKKLSSLMAKMGMA